MSNIRTRLLEAGVRNLKEFGYPEVNTENILTDMIYVGFFQSMLNDNLGKAGKEVDGEINKLLSDIEKSRASE